MVKLLLALAIVLFATLIYPKSADAESTTTTGSKIQISPAITDKEVSPGEKLTYPLQITNLSDTAAPVTVYVQNFNSHDAVGTIEFFSDARPLSADGWITITPPALIIEPHTSRTVMTEIAIPKTAEPGGRYVAVFVQPASPDTQNTPAVVVKSRVGSLFFLTVKGLVIRKLSVPRFIVPLFSLSPNITASLSLHNSGNVHLKPSGSLVVKNLLTKHIVTTLDLTAAQSLTTLPGSDRVAQIHFDTGSRIGIYSVEIALQSEHLNSLRSQRTLIVFPFIQIGLVVLMVMLFRITRHRWLKAWRAFSNNTKA